MGREQVGWMDLSGRRLLPWETFDSRVHTSHCLSPPQSLGDLLGISKSFHSTSQISTGPPTGACMLLTLYKGVSHGVGGYEKVLVSQLFVIQSNGICSNRVWCVCSLNEVFPSLRPGAFSSSESGSHILLLVEVTDDNPERSSSPSPHFRRRGLGGAFTHYQGLQPATASPAGDPENRNERHTERSAQHFLTALPSPKPINEVQLHVHREDASAAQRAGQGRQWGARPFFSHYWSPKRASFMPSSGCVYTLSPTSTPWHTILNKYAWPWSMWEFWRVTIVIPRNAQTPAKIHFPDAWLFWEPNLLL